MYEEEGLKFDLVLKETDFSRLSAQQRREKNHIERDREKWRHKSFWRMKHRFPADMDVDIPIVHGAAPRREWQVASVLHCKQLNRHRIAWACHKSIATASDFKEGGLWKDFGEEECQSIVVEWPFWKKLHVRKWHSLETLQAHSLDISSLPWLKKILRRKQRNIPSAKTFVHFFGDISTWNASSGDVSHFLVSLLVVRHVFPCKATSETHQKWIQKEIKKVLCKNLGAWNSDENPPNSPTAKLKIRPFSKGCRESGTNLIFLHRWGGKVDSRRFVMVVWNERCPFSCFRHYFGFRLS